MAGSFTAVDLSQLPAPPVVEVIDFEVILAEMIADLVRRDPSFSALVESDPAFKILEVAAFRETIIRQRVNDAARGVMLAYAGGADLEHIGALVGVKRQQIAPGNPDRGIPPTMEGDAELRRRIQLAPEGLSVAGPVGAYTFHALGADSRVLDASATSPAPGDVVVAVLSREGGGLASPDLVQVVAARLAAEDVRPLTDRVQVVPASLVAYEVDAVVYTYAGPDSAIVIAEALARVQGYIDASRRIGRDITRSAIFAALHVDGVQRVELHQPVADIVVSDVQAGSCQGVIITHGGIGD